VSLSEWVLYEPAKDNWPDLEWGRAWGHAEADWLLALHRQLYPETVFRMREVSYG
jgi:hypothetical protein